MSANTDEITQRIRQLANRLENSTSDERIDALQDLLTMVKQSFQTAHIVSEFALDQVINILKEQGSSDEYQEALDLIYRLVKSRDKDVARFSTEKIVKDVTRVELLLDLLEHEDVTIGVMTSQILTEMHSNSGAALEEQIQRCPDGMNKLLQRLPDSSREEVRNQAIVLIQQLTANNEEMKKTVVFNEGFEILLGIIQSEGGAADVGMVTQDCLQICNNILGDSMTCQRLFFSMGGADWVLRLAAFFDPLLLESKALSAGPSALDNSFDAQQSGGSTSWFEQPTRLSCAILALSALQGALSTVNPDHQALLAKSTAIVIPAAAFWLARRGPVQLVNAGLSLLYRVVEANPEVAERLSHELIKVPPAQVGRNIPHGIDASPLQFSWRPSQEDDRRLVSLVSLLAERYIYASETWFVEDGLQLHARLVFECDVRAGADAFAEGCLKVLERILSTSPQISDIMVQSVVAPPPPGDDSHGQQQVLESMTPLAAILLHLLVDGCQKVVGAGHQQQYGMQSGGPYRSDAVIVTERAANVLTLVFVHGSPVARELATVLTTQHASRSDSGLPGGRAAYLLPSLLATAGRTARIPNGGGYPVLVAILRLLATVASGRPDAVRAMLEDPTNLFVVDLATAASETAGVPAIVQIASCFFLGCCFDAFAEPPAADEEVGSNNSGGPSSAAGGAEAGLLTKQSFLTMIQSRVGLDRFTEILRKPLQAVTTLRGGSQQQFQDMFVSPGFRAFYEARVEAVRNGIFQFYAGAAGSASLDAATQQVIVMQRQRIAELEERLLAGGASIGHIDTEATVTAVVKAPDLELQTLREETQAAKLREEKLVADNSSLAAQLSELKGLLDEKESQAAGVADAQAQKDVEAAELVASLHEKLNEVQGLFSQSEERAASFEVAYNTLWGEQQSREERLAEEAVSLKQMVLREGEEKQRLAEEVAQLGRKIQMLETTDSTQAQSAVVNAALDKRVRDLEGRNAELKQQLWAVEAELASSKTQLLVATTSPMSDASALNQAEVSDVVDARQSQLALEKLSQSVTQLVLNMGVDVLDLPYIQEQLDDAQTAVSQKADLLEFLVSQCGEAVDTAAGRCSDLAEGAHLVNLEGKEGGVDRVVHCCSRLSELVHELRERAEESDRLRVELADSEADTRDEAAAREKAEADFLEQRDELVLLQTQYAELRAAHEKLESECALMRDELRCHLEQRAEHSQQVQHDHNLFVKIDTLTHENALLLAKHEELVATTAADRSALLGDIERLKHQLDVATSDLRAAEAKCDELASVSVSLESALQLAQSRAEESREEIDRLSQDLRMAQSTGDGQQKMYVDRISALELSESSLASELRIVTEKLSGAEKARDDLQVDLEALSGTHNSTCLRATQLESDLQRAEQATVDLQTEQETLQSELATLQQALVDAQEELIAMQDAAMAHAKQDAVVQRTMEEAQAEADRLTTALEHAHSEAAQLRSNVAAAESTGASVSHSAQLHIDELTAVISDLRAQAERHQAAHHEALSHERACTQEVMDKASELQSQHRLLVEEMSSLRTHKQQVESRLEKASAQVRAMEEEVSRASVQCHHAQKEVEELRAVCQRKDKEATQLRESFEAERLRIEAEVSAVNSSDPFRSQDQELRRISLSADKLSKDLHARELEVHGLQAQLRRKEGEVAGLSSALKSFESDMEAVRAENEELTERLAAGERLLKDLRRELSSLAASAQLEQGEVEGLRAQLQSERLKAQLKESQHRELTESTEAALREVAAWMASAFALAHMPTAPENSDGPTIDSLLSQVRLVRNLVESLAARLGAQVREMQIQLDAAVQKAMASREDLDKQHDFARLQAAQIQEQQEKLQQLSQQLQHQQQLFETQAKIAAAATAVQPAFESSSMRTPAKKSSGSSNGNGHSSGHHPALDLSGANGMLTPVHHSMSANLSRGTGGELVVSRVSSAVKAVHSSPAAKEASRLNAEILRERRKMSALQEQHTDLLGLLAQQEIELDVFRQALEAKLSERELSGVESEIQRSVIDKYGSYTNFRHYEGGGGSAATVEEEQGLFGSGNRGFAVRNI